MHEEGHDESLESREARLHKEIHGLDEIRLEHAQMVTHAPEEVHTEIIHKVKAAAEVSALDLSTETSSLDHKTHEVSVLSHEEHLYDQIPSPKEEAHALVHQEIAHHKPIYAYEPVKVIEQAKAEETMVFDGKGDKDEQESQKVTLGETQKHEISGEPTQNKAHKHKISDKIIQDNAQDYEEVSKANSSEAHLYDEVPKFEIHDLKHCEIAANDSIYIYEPVKVISEGDSAHHSTQTQKFEYSASSHHEDPNELFVDKIVSDSRRHSSLSAPESSIHSLSKQKDLISDSDNTVVEEEGSIETTLVTYGQIVEETVIVDRRIVKKTKRHQNGVDKEITGFRHKSHIIEGREDYHREHSESFSSSYASDGSEDTVKEVHVVTKKNVHEEPKLKIEEIDEFKREHVEAEGPETPVPGKENGDRLFDDFQEIIKEQRAIEELDFHDDHYVHEPPFVQNQHFYDEVPVEEPRELTHLDEIASAVVENATISALEDFAAHKHHRHHDVTRIKRRGIKKIDESSDDDEEKTTFEEWEETVVVEHSQDQSHHHRKHHSHINDHDHFYDDERKVSSNSSSSFSSDEEDEKFTYEEWEETVLVHPHEPHEIHVLSHQEHPLQLGLSTDQPLLEPQENRPPTPTTPVPEVVITPCGENIDFFESDEIPEQFLAKELDAGTYHYFFILSPCTSLWLIPSMWTFFHL